MLARRRHVVTGWEFLDDLDIRDQARPGEHALEEVVAQHGIVGHPALQGGLEGVDVVDALAGVGPLAEQILVDVGHRRRIGIDPTVGGKDALERRAFRTNRQRGRHAGLQYAVAFDNAALGLVEPRPVERMSHLADEPLDRVAWQARVGVEGDDKADIGGQRARGAVDERRVAGTAQQAIELMELAALALPSHPDALRFVPDAAPMQQQEAIGPGGVGIAGVEAGDAGGGHRHQVVVAREPLGMGVRPVGQNGEVDRPGGIGEIVNLEALDLLFDRLARRQQCRNGDQGAQVRWHALPQVEAGQQRGAESAGDRAIDQHQRRIDCGQEADQHHHRELPAGDAEERQHEQRQEENDAGRHGNTDDVAGDAHRREAPPQREAGRPEAEGPFEGPAAAADQVITRIALPAIAIACAGGRRRDLERAAGDFGLGQIRAARHPFDRGAVEVAGGEVHGGEIAAGAQDIVDRTDLLEQLCPVDVGDQAHAGDDVAHRDVGRALEIVLLADQLVGGRAFARQSSFQPANGGRRLGVLVAQALDELDDEALGERRPLVGLERPGIGHEIAHAQQPVGHGVGLLAFGAAAHDADGRASEILHQHDAQRDRHSPQLADAERLDVLVGAHETGQGFGVEPAVRMSDEGPCDPEHAGVARQRTAAQLGKLAVVARRQVGSNFTNLLFDEVIVVEQPIRRGGDRPALVGGLGEPAIGIEQDAFVMGQAIHERPAGRGRRRNGLVGGKAFRVLLQPFDAEKLAADGIFVIP